MTLADTVAAGAARLAGHALGAYDTSERPRPSGPALEPHTAGRRYTFTHYNVVIADLPEPHRHLACMVLAGRAGAEVFDHDEIVVGTPANTVTTSIGTAATGSGWFETYDLRTACDLRPDGSHLKIGNDLLIEGSFPNYRIVIERPGLHLELDAECTGQVTWFTHSPIYRHLGYPARYRGTLTHEGTTQDVSGMLSLEHAQVWSLTALRDRNVPRRLKLPWNFFTYHVIQLNPETMLMLSRSEAFTKPVVTGAWLKGLDGASKRWVSGEVVFDILDHRTEPQVAPDGSVTHLPSRFRWRIHGSDGEVVTEINARTDTDFVYGVGKGWIGGYRYTGTHEGQPVEGIGYLEYARTR